MKDAVERDRTELLGGLPHRRTATMGAKLLFGLQTFLDFALEAGALEAGEHSKLLERGRTAILSSLSGQAEHLRDADSARTFLKLLAAALQSGEAHLQDAKTGGVPGEGEGSLAMLVGWQRFAADALVPRGVGVGFVDAEGEEVFLTPEAAIKGAWKMAPNDPTASVVSRAALSKALEARGLLLSKDGDGERRTKTVRLAGRPRGVYHIALSSLFPESANNANNGNDPPPDAPDGELFPFDVPVPTQGTGTLNGNTIAPPASGRAHVPDVPVVSAARAQAPEDACGEGQIGGKARWES